MYGELKIVDSMFLGKEELSRLQSYLVDKVKLLFQMGAYGVFPGDFNFIQGSNGTISLEKDSIAIDADGNIIFKEKEYNIEVKQGISWLTIEKDDTGVELGTVNISVGTAGQGTGTMTGIGTKFLETLRGDISSKPIKVNFIKNPSSLDTSLLNADPYGYLVQQVVSDTEATILGVNGVSVLAESGLKYRVIGTFSQGLDPSDDKKYIYNNNGCKMVLSTSEPAHDEKNVFLIARLSRSGATVTIEDRRQTYYIRLEDFVTVPDWEVLSLNSGFSHNTNDRVSVRFANFKHHIELKGTFTTSNTTGTLCVLPTQYRPVRELYFDLMKADQRTVKLRVTTAGEVQVYGTVVNVSGGVVSLAAANYSTSGNNVIVNKIVSIV